MNEWISEDYQSKIVEFLKSNRVKLSFPDQNIFNCAIRKDIHSLPINYNIPPHAYMFNDALSKTYFNDKFRNVNYEEIKQATANPKIIHSYGLSGIKPWQTTFNPFYEEYIKYIKKINPDFTPTELDDFKKIVVKFPHLYKMMLLARTYMTESLEKPVRTLALKCQQYGHKKH